MERSDPGDGRRGGAVPRSVISSGAGRGDCGRAETARWKRTGRWSATTSAREANKDKVAAQQKSIALVRKAQGMTQSGLAAIVGVTQATVSRWETGALKANWDKLCAVLPELEAYRA